MGYLLGSISHDKYVMQSGLNETCPWILQVIRSYRMYQRCIISEKLKEKKERGNLRILMFWIRMGLLFNDMFTFLLHYTMFTIFTLTFTFAWKYQGLQGNHVEIMLTNCQGIAHKFPFGTSMLSTTSCFENRTLQHVNTIHVRFCLVNF